MNNLKNNENRSSSVRNKRPKTKKESCWSWPIKVFFLAVALSLLFGTVSEHFMSEAGMVLAVIIVLILISVSVITDMIGIAVVASNEAPFKSMILKKVRGARQGLSMVQNAAKIASLCADVIGDVCGVLSGAAGVT
ncbi:MAG: hypothetical protein PHX09_02495, partial [Clostridia bacterium]|nr:hypothetical protein [Clostridia bacterium]